MADSTRAQRVNAMSPHLRATVWLYPTPEGGRSSLAYPGWGCPCCPVKGEPVIGYDAWIQFGNQPFAPGETRDVGFVFLSGEVSVRALTPAGMFYLWEGRFIGEATILA